MLTLRQALKLPSLKKARVVAGEMGLDQVVRRVHVVDIPDATYAWGQGALLLTAGYGLKDSPERQAALIPTLVKRELVGMIFSVGWYFDSVPRVIRAAANAHKFPVIEVPPDVQFIDITERLYVEIVNEQFALKERADHIHHQLTQLVLKGGDLTTVAETLAKILERSVLIDGAAFEVLAHAEHGPVDESRLRAIRMGRTSPEIVSRMMKRGIYDEIRQKMRHVRLAAMPEIGMTMERIVSPIIVGGEIYGYLWIVAGDHPLIELDELALDHAATVAALVLLKEQAVRDAQQQARGDFLAQLLRLNGEVDSGMLERAHPIGYQFDKPHQVLFVFNRAPTHSADSPLSAQLEKWLRSSGEWGLVVLREHGIAIVIEAKSNSTGQALAQKLIAKIGSPTLVVGVGQVHPDEKSLRRSYDEALVAAEIGQRLTSGPSVSCHWELGLLDWLYRLPREVLNGNPYLAKIEVLAAHDRRSNSDLVNTLELYLEYGGALADAAAALNVHRNTLLYRLGRIEEIADIDLKDVRQRLNLHVALKSYRLKE